MYRLVISSISTSLSVMVSVIISPIVRLLFIFGVVLQLAIFLITRPKLARNILSDGLLSNLPLPVWGFF